MSSIIAIVALVLSLFQSTDCMAQRNDSRSVIAATISSVVAGMREPDSDAQINGPVAFDPWILRAPLGPAPTGWPDTVTLRWIGNVRDTTFAATVVESVLHDVNAPEGSVTLVTCGTPASGRCNSLGFAAVIALSEPRIVDDQAQVLVFVRYRSNIDAHPHAWYASVAHLTLVDGHWVAGKWYNRAGT